MPNPTNMQVPTAAVGTELGRHGNPRAALTVRSRESGSALVGFLAVLLPLTGLAAAAVIAMNGRSGRLLAEVNQERALQAAEAGIDVTRLLGVAGTLADGAEITRTLAGGASFRVVADSLKTDGVDNDGDGQTDEADEDVFELVSTGSHGTAVRRVVGYLSREPGMPPIDSAMVLYKTNPQVQIDFKGTGYIRGADTNMDGTAGPQATQAGLSIKSPGTIASLTANYAVDQPARITGNNGPPSLRVTTSTFDLNALIAEVTASPDIVLGAAYVNATWGTAPAGPWRHVRRGGDLQLSGNVQGTGVLLVTGKLQVTNTFRWDGLVIVLGDVQMDGNVTINGALIQGPASNQTQFANNVKIRYSSEALSLALPGIGLGKFTVVSGWQEISR
jgi:hypothetical protein